MRKIRYQLVLAVSPLALICVTSPAQAQDKTTQASDEGIEDIIVTATRQNESINRVPLSVSALSRDALDSRGVRDFSDVVRQTPGVTIERSNTTSNIAIRGVNSSVGAATKIGRAHV